jgi:sulfite oxidase
MAAHFSRRDWLRFSSAAAGGLVLSRWQALGWAAEPASKDLIVHGQDPFNAEPALEHLVADAITPLAHFYVRNHGPIPTIQEGSFRLKVEGLVNKPLELTLGQIKDRFQAHTAVATLTCAGNRRSEMSAIRLTGGVQWNPGAIGNAKWTGVTLADVLKAAELRPEAKHVWFEGADPIKHMDGATEPFGASISLDKAQSKTTPTLLANEMNDQPLAVQHGFPLRTVVPGYIGARSVKWLSKIVVSDRPSPNHFMTEAYKLVTTDSKDDLAKAEPIYEFPINAAICAPAAREKLEAGETAIQGYALPPGDGRATIAKVEISADGGRNWKPTTLIGKPAPCCWQLWQARLPLAAGKHELIVRATDSTGRVQPQKCEWNLKGYLYNAWHRASVETA